VATARWAVRTTRSPGTARSFQRVATARGHLLALSASSSSCTSTSTQALWSAVTSTRSGRTSAGSTTRSAESTGTSDPGSLRPESTSISAPSHAGCSRSSITIVSCGAPGIRGISLRSEHRGSRGPRGDGCRSVRVTGLRNARDASATPRTLPRQQESRTHPSESHPHHTYGVTASVASHNVPSESPLRRCAGPPTVAQASGTLRKPSGAVRTNLCVPRKRLR
jgi:hypothetical protein